MKPTYRISLWDHDIEGDKSGLGGFVPHKTGLTLWQLRDAIREAREQYEDFSFLVEREGASS